ncbi:hypothetical protein [Guptibacillus algicola]|uniref:hypothetical protein n=1 Tax=Guptibacillus algicola TaxID=225844 RepID=UPI001CD314FF|nr:hypothetical protein [Alkalihalobacillus algicola]MCA0987619.1 hypothetical protein [Alkalihalobacillus algicola]
MDEKELVMDWITSELNCDSLQIGDYPLYNCGKYMKDQSGDYLIVYFHPEREEVVYTFKDNEDVYFSGNAYQWGQARA